MVVDSLARQFRNNAVSLVSLAVALSALGYNTWRNELTERNRNIRAAGFELLTEVGSLQQITFYAHFSQGDQRGDPRMGWVDMLTINDLAALMPATVGQAAGELKTAWRADAAGLGEDDAAFQRIDRAIDGVRQATLESLRALE